MKYILSTLVLAAIMHFGAVFSLPYVIMTRVMSRAPANVMQHSLPTDAASRAIVKPAPDLLYSLCSYDLSKGDVKITVAPYHTYWSVGFYAANSDNFHISKEVKPIVLSMENKQGALKSPSPKGIVLFRFLVQSPDDLEKAKLAQKEVKCDAVTGL
jgi:hypothetical protein